MKYSLELKLKSVKKYKNSEYITTPGKTSNHCITHLKDKSAVVDERCKHRFGSVLYALRFLLSDSKLKTHT